MELHKWQGPRDEAVPIMAALSNARLIYLTNEDEAVLLQETEKGTHLPGASAYQIIDAAGDINKGFFAVFNNVPVSEDGRELFESRFQNRARLIEKEPGFQAIRILRPLSSDTYAILTLWDSEDSFKAWQESEAYGTAHAKRKTAEGIDQRPNIFPRPSYVTTYIR